MRDRKKNRMRVTVLDEEGRVRCERGGETLAGALAANIVRPKTAMRLAVTGSGDENVSFEIVGRADVQTDEPVRAGLAFWFEIARVTRATALPEEDPFSPKTTCVVEVITPSNALPSGFDDPTQPPTSSPASFPPSMDHQFAAAFGAMDSEPSGVYGNLRGMSLPEVLQSLEHGRRYATILIRPKRGPTGILRCEEGQVIFGLQGSLLGEDAFFSLARVSRGSFLIQFHDVRPAGLVPNISQHLHWLLLEAARRMDEESLSHFTDTSRAAASDLRSALESVIVQRNAATDAASGPGSNAASNAASSKESVDDSAVALGEVGDLNDANDDAFERGITRPALFSKYFTEAEPTSHGTSSPLRAHKSALELDDEIEEERRATGDGEGGRSDNERDSSGWTGSFSSLT